MRDNISVGMIFAFSSFAFKLLTPLNRLMKVKYSYISIEPALIRYTEFLQKKCEESGSIKIKQITSLKLEEATFKYPHNNPIIKKVNMEFERGNIYSIVGKNGSGKSTIIEIILGLLRTTGGSYKVNGINFCDIDIESLRSHIAIAEHNPSIFNDNLMNNITLFGKYNLKSNSYLNNFIESFYHDTGIAPDDKLWSNGIRLSSGERQKIALMRLMAKDSHVLILDEAMTNIDGASKEQFMSYLSDIKEKKIIINISHNTIDHYLSNHIYQIQDGVITSLTTMKGKVAQQ